MSKVTLYHTQGCHLCDQALELLKMVFDESDIQLQDIVDDEKLMSLYQTSIPVVEQNHNGNKLYWPFNEQEIKGL
ncbi:glutaredoxin family protein [Pseudoalteromonas denitrificans]|uniref:Glutaredoxin-like domain n=1 Tax=Pseudoalteromonas denitrificans DSM 6059 TaxID=1123010 RepID=A0A1I1NF80_9GAMM|nr:glutaredoxin family protein [Pseudoalteromonas denitrificans]SFC96279.1 Glutaredoxin-like domain [Pseudoalteromonas denitrificans DSM 6059]